MENKKYKFYTKEQKIAYGKQFSKEQRDGYAKGKRYGFLQGIHKSPKKKQEFAQHDYSNTDLNEMLFDNIDDFASGKRSLT